MNVNERVDEVPISVPVPIHEEEGPVGDGVSATVAVIDGLGVQDPVDGIEAQGSVSVCCGQYVGCRQPFISLQGCWDWEGRRMGGRWVSLDSDSDSPRERSILPVVEAELESDWSP